MLIKKGFFLIKSQGSDDSYEEEILACSESKCEIQKELDSYSLQSKSELEQYKRICSEIKNYTLKARKFISTIGDHKSTKESRKLKKDLYFKENPVPETISEHVYYCSNSGYLSEIEPEYPAEYSIREFGISNE